MFKLKTEPNTLISVQHCDENTKLLALKMAMSNNTISVPEFDHHAAQQMNKKEDKESVSATM